MVTPTSSPPQSPTSRAQQNSADRSASGENEASNRLQQLSPARQPDTAIPEPTSEMSTSTYGTNTELAKINAGDQANTGLPLMPPSIESTASGEASTFRLQQKTSPVKKQPPQVPNFDSSSGAQETPEQIQFGDTPRKEGGYVIRPIAIRQGVGAAAGAPARAAAAPSTPPSTTIKEEDFIFDTP